MGEASSCRKYAGFVGTATSEVNTTVAPRFHVNRGATTVRKVKLAGDVDRVDVHVLEQVHRHVGDLLGMAEHVLAEPQRKYRHLLDQDVLGVLPVLLGGLLARRLGALLDQAVEGRVGVAV